MNSFFSASLVLFAVVSVTSGLKCYVCSGSEESDCAKGVKTAGVEVNCEVPNYAPHTSTLVANTSTAPVEPISAAERHHQKLQRLGCFEPLKMYPACVTYSVIAYNSAKRGQKMINRACAYSPEDYCLSFSKFNKDATCKSCNSTDFCM